MLVLPGFEVVNYKDNKQVQVTLKLLFTQCTEQAAEVGAADYVPFSHQTTWDKHVGVCGSEGQGILSFLSSPPALLWPRQGNY
jgi:hypothetical protein